MVELTSSRIDSPPRCVGNRNSPNNDDDTDVVDSRAEGISVNDLKAAGSRVCLESTEVLMHIPAIGGSALQSESNRFRSHKAQSRVDNDRFEELVSAADLASMGSFEVVMNRPEVLEERMSKWCQWTFESAGKNRWSTGSGWDGSLAGESLDSSCSGSSAKTSLQNWTPRHQRRPSSYPLSKVDMRYLEVPRRRTKSAASTKGKRLMYSSLVE